MKAVWVSRIDELLKAKSRVMKHDVTIADLAKYINVSRQTIHTWKGYKGVARIPAEHTAKMCEFFGVNEWELWALEVIDEPEPCEAHS